MVSRIEITPSEKALSQLPIIPVSSNDQRQFDEILDAVEHFLVDHDTDELCLETISKELGISTDTVYRYFPNPAAAAAGLTIRFVHLASTEIMSNQAQDESRNWQGVVKEILRRGQLFYQHHPAAQNLRLGASQPAGVRHVIVTSAWALAEVIEHELRRLYRLPPHAKLQNDLAYAIIMADALCSLSFQLYGKITEELAEEAERAVATLLEPLLGTKLPLRTENS